MWVCVCLGCVAQPPAAGHGSGPPVTAVASRTAGAGAVAGVQVRRRRLPGRGQKTKKKGGPYGTPPAACIQRKKKKKKGST